jgi:carboxypeptidase C (cathepsin A)
MTNASKLERIIKKRYSRRVMRFWDKSEEFNETTWVVGNYVIFLVLNQKPEYMVEIHDPVMARNMRNLFKAIWSEVK